MGRRSASLVLVLIVVLGACSGSPGATGNGSTVPESGSSGAATTSGGDAATSAAVASPGAAAGGGASLAAAAAQVADWCTFIPIEIIARFAPSAPPAAAGSYPGECGASNGVGALEFRYQTGFGAFEIPAGAEQVQGLGQGAYVDRPSVDEVELHVALQADPQVTLFIDVAGHDGKDHTDDAVDIAKAIITELGG